MRLKITRLIYLLFLLAVFARLFYWQIIRGDELSAKAEGQHFKDVKIESNRGRILYSDGFVLAATQPSFTLFGLPKTIPEDQKLNAASKIAKILSDEAAFEKTRLEIFNQLSRDLYWVPLKKNVDSQTKKSLEELGISGIGFEASNNRYYPEGSSSAHLLGFVGSNAEGEKTGYFGTEGFYDGELKGIRGLTRNEKDALGIPILIGHFFTNQAKDGKDLVLNIDRSVQFIVEESLKNGIEKYGAKAGSVVIMDPKTGAILAMASYPNYDPSKYSDFPKEFYKNPVVADSYEPGSTFKVLTMAAAINENVLKPDTKCDICDKPIQIGEYSIKTWNNHYFPDTSMAEGIIHSDNTAMVFTSKKLGLDKFYSYIENFGFGKTTNIDLQDEFSPDLRSKNQWREIDLATASFGQGIAVTPIQMVRAVSVIANGGNLMEPHVVKQIKDNSSTFDIKPKVIKKVISENAAKTITDMMVKAVNEGEAKFVKVKGFKVAGKTGTAEIPLAGHYDSNKTIASFIGFAPADGPKFVMLVRYNEPTSSIFGAETAAPTFFEIAKQLFPYFKIAPTEQE